MALGRWGVLREKDQDCFGKSEKKGCLAGTQNACGANLWG